MTVRVVLADDQQLVRAGFGALLAGDGDIEVVGEAETGFGAVRLSTELRPDVVLMDIRMPDLDGIEATRRIGADPALASTRVVVLTTFELDEYLFEALSAGASGFLAKDIEPSELRHAVRVVAEGAALISPRMTQRLVKEFVSRPTTPGAPARAQCLDVLTDRERSVVELVAEGLSNDEIGRRLHMSPATAKTHVSRSMIKLNARDRAQLVVMAYRSGLVRPD